MAAYYNEFRSEAAAWLRELIKQGHIADGHVDERSIVDVKPDDLHGFKQCHFFAGIGVWSHSLRKAGWPDYRPVWTGSCPCQPFSAAGKGNGFDDERHLWPHFHWLISQCRPDVVFGEQVASKDGLGWFDLVQADLEGTGYACGAVDTCAAGFGAPHIRQRLYWVGKRLDDATGARHVRTFEKSESNSRDQTRLCLPSEGSGLSGLVNSVRSGLEGQRNGFEAEVRWKGAVRPVAASGEFGRLADPNCDEQWQGRDAGSKTGEGLWSELGGCSIDRRPRPTSGLWSNADWLFCRDGKWRPVEPGTFPLAHGAAARVGRLRGYGNAIVAEQATAFVEAFIEVDSERRGANDHPST